jgi:hypothetical protein
MIAESMDLAFFDLKIKPKEFNTEGTESAEDTEKNKDNAETRRTQRKRREEKRVKRTTRAGPFEAQGKQSPTPSRSERRWRDKLAATRNESIYKCFD